MSFVPGMTGAVASMGENPLAPLLGISIHSNTVANAVSIAWPATRLKGDVAILFDSAGDLGAAQGALGSPPTGFTSPIGMSNSVYKHRVSYRILDGTETGSISGLTSSDEELKRLILVRGTNSIIREVFEEVIKQSDNTGSPDSRPINLDATLEQFIYPRIVFASCLQVRHESTGAITFTTESPAFSFDDRQEITLNNANYRFDFRVGWTTYARDDSGFSHTVNTGAAFLSGGVFAFR